MIRVITEPKVYLVGRQEVEANGLELFLDDEALAPNWATDAPSAAESLVEIAGRVCYSSFKNPRPGGNKAYVGHILDVGHGSVVEHAVFSFIIAGVSRSLTHELVRHRAGFSFSQLSQRFVDEGDCAFVLPPLYKDLGAPGAMGWMMHLKECVDMYSSLVKMGEAMIDDTEDKTLRRKRAREAARSVLPNCVEAKIFVTANARALRNFLELRGSKHADAEIRRLALVLLGVLAAEAPNLFGDYRVETSPEGIEEIVTDHRKV